MLASGALLLGMKLAGHDALRLTRDVTTTADVTPWTGFFSTLGLLAVAASVGACVLTGVTLRRHGHRQAGFFLATAALLAYLLVDDAFLIHEYIAPVRLGVAQNLVYMLIVAGALAWAVRFRRDVADRGLGLLALAGAASGASLLLDAASKGLPLVEDWLKFAGIAALTAWVFERTLTALDAAALRDADIGWPEGDEELEAVAGAPPLALDDVPLPPLRAADA